MNQLEKLEIITLPHESLREPSIKVGFIDAKIKKLVEKMIAQAILWEKGRPHETTVGLAAIQINQPLKVIIVRENPKSTTEQARFQPFINPKITKYSGIQSIELEGCLSVPKYYTHVERYESVKVSALDLDGQSFTLKAEGFLARVLQHELDHLKGVMTVDRAVEVTDKTGQSFAFCQLVGKKFEIAETEKVAKSGILQND